MAWFYTIVLVVATVILILALTIVGIAITKTGNKAPFPDFQNTCPDFWTLSGSVCSPPITGVNVPTGTQPALQHTGVTVSNNKISAIDIGSSNWTSLCDKQSWASSNGIFWDGVANNNGCS
jgi:hypothetical protein